MLEMIEDRKGSAFLEERRDLMSNLIRASMEKIDPQKDIEFTQSDLLGNIFIFLIAGKLFHLRYISFTHRAMVKVMRLPRVLCHLL